MLFILCGEQNKLVLAIFKVLFICEGIIQKKSGATKIRERIMSPISLQVFQRHAFLAQIVTNNKYCWTET